VTYTICHIDTIRSPDDGHMAARNMQRIKINIHEKEFCLKFVIYQDYTEMCGQQNIKNDKEYLEKNVKLANLSNTFSFRVSKMYVHFLHVQHSVLN
jgi:hypothetical protein